MADLIDRAAAIELLKKATEEVGVLDFEDIECALNILPSAQPEIIRCKDCLIHGICRFEQGLGLDGYCSQAERRTDG